VEIKCQLDATDGFFIADLTACSTCFGHHYASHQELKSIIQVVAACGIWCCKDGRCNIKVEWYSCFLGMKYRVLYRVSHDLWALLPEVVSYVLVIKKVHTNMCPVLDGYGVMGVF